MCVCVCVCATLPIDVHIVLLSNTAEFSCVLYLAVCVCVRRIVQLKYCEESCHVCHSATPTLMKALKCKTLGGIHIHHALSHIEQQVPRTFHTHNGYRQAVYCTGCILRVMSKVAYSSLMYPKDPPKQGKLCIVSARNVKRSLHILSMGPFSVYQVMGGSSMSVRFTLNIHSVIPTEF